MTLLYYTVGAARFQGRQFGPSSKET